MGMVRYLQEWSIRQFVWEELNKIFPNGVPVPIPVEHIIEFILKIELAFDELDEGILGFTNFSQNKICISSRLLDNGEIERMRFTMAHEVGHYFLHRFCFQEQGYISYQRSRDFYQDNAPRIERQANLFAANILMPAPLLFDKWIQVTGSEEPYSLAQEEQKNVEIFFLGGKNFNFLTSHQIISEIAQCFETSYQSTQIQLEQLGCFIDVPSIELIKCTSQTLREQCSLDKLLSRKEAAEMLGVKDTTLATWHTTFARD
jgi:Zn-dependent peptidase ImmA (M78 family)